MLQVLGVHPQPLGKVGPPLLELLRREEPTPLGAHLEAVLEGVVVQWKEYLLQDAFQIPVKKCSNDGGVLLGRFDVLLFLRHYVKHRMRLRMRHHWQD